MLLHAASRRRLVVAASVPATMTAAASFSGRIQWGGNGARAMSAIPHDPQAAKVAIAAVRDLDLRTATIERIRDLLEPVLRGYRVCAPRFEAGIPLFRSRI